MTRTTTAPVTHSPGSRPQVGHTAPAPAINSRGLRKVFGSLVAVDNLDLTIRPGEVVAFLGPNGAGKSTTLDMILGLTRPDAGMIELLGTSPNQAVQVALVSSSRTAVFWTTSPSGRPCGSWPRCDPGTATASRTLPGSTTSSTRRVLAGSSPAE